MGVIARPLAWVAIQTCQFPSLKFPIGNTLHEGLKIAESAVEVFREVVPLDAPGLGDALYLVAARMLETGTTTAKQQLTLKSLPSISEKHCPKIRNNAGRPHSLSITRVVPVSPAPSELMMHSSMRKQAVEVLHERKGWRCRG